MNFIEYTFKPAFGFVMMLVSIIQVLLTSFCYMYDYFGIFLIAIALYLAFVGTMIAGSYYRYLRYKEHEFDYKMRNLHETMPRHDY